MSIYRPPQTPQIYDISDQVSSVEKSKLPFVAAIMVIVILFAGYNLVGKNIFNKKKDSAPEVQSANTQNISIEKWKLFTSENYNFSIKYPPELTVEKNSDSSHLDFTRLSYNAGKDNINSDIPTNGYFVDILFRDLATESTPLLAQQAKDGYQSQCPNADISTIVDLILSGKGAKLLTVENCQKNTVNKNIYIKGDKFIYQVNITVAGNKENREKYKGLTDKIISTFTVLEKKLEIKKPELKTKQK